MAEIVPSVEIVKKGDMMGISKIVNDNKTNMELCSSPSKHQKPAVSSKT